jgi:hypothetical protein
MGKDGLNWIGSRISCKEGPEASTVVITARIERWKEGLLLAWVLGWMFAGAYFVYTLFGENTQEQKVYLIILLSFWLYFEFRITRAFFWRKYGNEFIKIDNDVLVIKKAIGRYGKARTYFIENIRDLQKADRPEYSLSRQFESSFWVIGGEMIHFTYMGRQIYFGRQLSDTEAADLAKWINKQLKKTRA